MCPEPDARPAPLPVSAPISGGSDISIADPAGPGVDLDTLPGGMVVLTDVADVRRALAGLADETYDLILHPAFPDTSRGGRPADSWRGGEIRLLPSGLPPLSHDERATLAAFHGLITARDAATGAHSHRVRIYALALARAHGMTAAELRDLEHGVILHDIGKIGIPDSILLKPGPLSAEEWAVMRTHPAVGRHLVENIPFLAGAVPIVYHHHERWDGNGYPERLRGTDIPLGARIFAVADALDAMTFDRPYSRAVSLDVAREEIARCAGTHFDPTTVATFMAIAPSTLEELQRRATS